MANDMWTGLSQNSRMARNTGHNRVAAARLTKAKEAEEAPPIYVKQWLNALGLKPTKVAEEAGVNKGYMSEIMKGTKDNPSPTILKKIAAVAGIDDWRDFYDPPPPADAVGKVKGLSQALVGRLYQRKN